MVVARPDTVDVEVSGPSSPLRVGALRGRTRRAGCRTRRGGYRTGREVFAGVSGAAGMVRPGEPRALMPLLRCRSRSKWAAIWVHRKRRTLTPTRRPRMPLIPGRSPTSRTRGSSGQVIPAPEPFSRERTRKRKDPPREADTRPRFVDPFGCCCCRVSPSTSSASACSAASGVAPRPRAPVPRDGDNEGFKMAPPSSFPFIRKSGREGLLRSGLGRTAPASCGVAHSVLFARALAFCYYSGYGGIDAFFSLLLFCVTCLPFLRRKLKLLNHSPLEF